MEDDAGTWTLVIRWDGSKRGLLENKGVPAPSLSELYGMYGG